jgi:predicted transcriptional regulator
MEMESTLKQMALLEKEINREILKLLLRGSKDFNSICRDIKKSRSAVFGSLKDLQEMGMIDRRKIDDESRGRPGYEYFIRNFHFPELTRTNLLEFLNGIDFTSKFISLTEISYIDDLSRYIPVSTEFFLNLMLSSGIKFKYAIQVLIELGSQLDHQLDYDELVQTTMKIIKEKYPIDGKTLESFMEKSGKEIIVFSEDTRVDLTRDEARRIAMKELGLEDFEAEYITSSILISLRLLGINEIPYAPLVNFMYTLAQNHGMACKKTPFFFNVTEFSVSERLIITILVKNKKEKWSFSDFSDYLRGNKNFAETKCNFLASLIIEKLLTIGLEEYDIKFIDSLSDELAKNFRI